MDPENNNLKANIKMEINSEELDSTSNIDDYSKRMHNQTTSIGRYCRNCQQKIVDQTNGPVEETMSRLGLTPPEEVFFNFFLSFYK